MVKKDITIQLSEGLEARPVAVFVQIASTYDANIMVNYKGKNINAKSIMGMMSLGIPKGETITLSAEGKEEEAAVIAIEKYLSDKE